jgi:hypothetical protein
MPGNGIEISDLPAEGEFLYAFMVSQINEGVTSLLDTYWGITGLPLSLGYVGTGISKRNKHQYL